MFGWIRVGDPFTFVFCSSMCLYVLSSVLWCPDRNDVPFICTPSCLLKGSCFIVNCTHVHRNTERQISKKNHAWFSTTNVTTLLTRPTTPLVRWLHVLLSSSFTCSSFIWFCIFCHWKIFWRFYFLWIIVIAYFITYNVSILMTLKLRILLILKGLLLTLIVTLKSTTEED
jgi:hypothetical protein